jgi:hypothetical protein
MTAYLVRRFFFVMALLAFPAAGYAQEAVLTGTVTDSTGGVLPGVTVTAIHEATGNRFEATTDERGIYRIPARVGAYQIRAELPGFATVARTGVQLLAGQTASVNMQMAVSTLQETVTVTGEAPLIETTTSSVGGNIDPRQVSELPIQGREWTTLALLAPGNRTTDIGGTPVQDRADVREYHVNVDGQQVTQTMGIGGQPLYSRDAIAEFQFISNRFDATQGRSSGVQVNVVTKSGTNALAGTFGSYFRDDAWNAADPVARRVLPYSDTQVSGALGGPILRDRLHFFGNYEYEREPKTSVWTTPYPAFNLSLEGKRSKRIGGGRVDYQVSPALRLMTKVHFSNDFDPFGSGGGTTHPSSSDSQDRDSAEYLVQLTHVMSNRALNELKGGFAGWQIDQRAAFTTWSNHWQKGLGITNGGPRLSFRGFTFGGNGNRPRVRDQNMYTLRDDFSYSYNARGRHDLRAGGEYLFMHEMTRNCRSCSGRIIANAGPVPANIEALFPDPFNADTWNLNGIPSAIMRRYEIGISETFVTAFDVPRLGAWVQDDWSISNRLTLNLGLRYDLIVNAWANDSELLPWMERGRPDDTDNVQPRLGFAYTLNDRTVVRGGAGLYYGDILTNLQMWAMGNETIASIEIENDGRRDFATNPFNGPPPTPDQAFARFCDVNNRPGCLVRAIQEIAPPVEYAHVTRSAQTSIGIARQVGDDMAIEVDYVYNGSRDEKVIQDNINLTYDPATGNNFPYSDESTRAYPLFGLVSMTPYSGWSNYHGVQSSFTKRFSSNWQASATYTLSGLWNANPLPMSGLRQVTFPVAKDLGNDYTLAETDQRHRVVLNGIWQVGYGFQMSGIYFYGAGEREGTSCGCDARDLGEGPDRLRLNGTVIPRNNFVKDPIHRVDVRFQQRVPLGGRVRVDGMVEVFNLFNRANYGSFTTNESSANYGRPSQNTNLAYTPRSMQLGFRLTF